ncbi:GreA/GreB family elongation factor [Brevibacillus sp. SYSU BS000544]|uniref:GreA/GreB family elongation factor n=1 Tax=Brevibacillus sp. SYSU BS000544 TaxID=3416443 RepID=UPI003CE4F307
MNHSIVSGTRKHLVNQLLFFDEEQSNFLQDYFPDQGKEKQSMERFIQQYSQTLEKLLAMDDSYLAQSLLSVALLGSSVKVIFQDDGLEEQFTVVYPTEIDPDRNRISLLSPIGRQLLLVSPNDSIVLKTPVGEQNVLIGEINFSYIGGFLRN